MDHSHPNNGSVDSNNTDQPNDQICPSVPTEMN